MIFYQLEDQQLVGTQAEAKGSHQPWVQVDIPVDKHGLMAYLNNRTPGVRIASIFEEEIPHHPDCPATDGFGCICDGTELHDDETPAGMSALNAPEVIIEVPKKEAVPLNIEVQIEHTILSTTYAKAEHWQSLCINRMVEIIAERQQNA
jgi:hypothetical protein